MSVSSASSTSNSTVSCNSSYNKTCILDSDDSFNSFLSSYTQIRGLPDIFHPSNYVPQPIADRRSRISKTVSFSFDSKDIICRICHGGNSSGNLLTPCNCKGSIALAHLRCLEIWLNESNRNECELCKYHFKIVREPKYSIFWSILVFLRHPGQHFTEMMVDLFTLVIYTPTTITATYMLMLLCESIARNAENRRSFASHLTAFLTVFGIAAINFTYTSWVVLTIEKYVDYWKDWYRQKCFLRVVLSSSDLGENSSEAALD